jgi:hypothetical protein
MTWCQPPPKSHHALLIIRQTPCTVAVKPTRPPACCLHARDRLVHKGARLPRRRLRWAKAHAAVQYCASASQGSGAQSPQAALQLSAAAVSIYCHNAHFAPTPTRQHCHTHTHASAAPTRQPRMLFVLNAQLQHTSAGAGTKPADSGGFRQLNSFSHTCAAIMSACRSLPVPAAANPECNHRDIPQTTPYQAPCDSPIWGAQQ